MSGFQGRLLSERVRSQPSAARFFQLGGLLAAFLVTCLVGGVLLAGLVLPAAGGVGYLTRSATDYYDQLPSDLALPPLSQSSRMVDADGNLIAVFYSENRSITSVNQVSPYMRNAVIAIEDARFYEHGGVDIRGTLRALVNNLTGGQIQGASTLTQQFVKNIQLEQAVYNNDTELAQAVVESSGLDGIGRKVRETRLAISLEEELTKEEILEGYLNIANFSNATFGVQAAARYYFSVNAADLTLPQAATLAGIVQLPGRYDPIDNPDNAVSRRNVVLNSMFENDFITREEYDAAVEAPLGLQVEEPQRGCASAGNAAFFCDYVVARFLADPRYGETVVDRENLLNRGGLTIRTTLNPIAQGAAAAAVVSQFASTERVGAAMSVVEPGTGQIIAMAQNRSYGLDREAPGVTAINFNVDQQYNGTSIGFQPGSNFKPAVLAEYLSKGGSLSDQVGAPGQISVAERQFMECGEPRRSTQTWSPGNAGGSGSGSVSVSEATYRSINTAYVNMALKIDLCDIANTAFDLGVHPADAPDETVDVYPAMILGAEEVAPLSIATMYATFAADGVRCLPIGVTSITDRESQELEIPDAECEQVLEPDVARGVTAALQETIVRGTASRVTESGRLLEPYNAAGKTGTTNNFREVWFSGYTPNLAASVWVGDPAVDGNKLNLVDFPINGEQRSRVFGSTYALPIWTDFMLNAPAAMGLPVENFTAPGADILNGPLTAVPSVVGQTVEQAQATLSEAGFTPVVSNERRFDPRVPSGLVAAQSPSNGALRRAGEEVVLLVSGGERRDGDGDGGDGGGGDLGDLDLPSLPVLPTDVPSQPGRPDTGGDQN